MNPSRFISCKVLRLSHSSFHSSTFRATQVQRRPFSFTFRAQAAEDPDAFMARVKNENSTLFRKIADTPELLSVLQKLSQIMQSKGVDFASGKPPSALQMMKLASNSEFREAASRFAEEMKKAGIDVRSKEVMDELMRLGNPGGPKN